MTKLSITQADIDTGVRGDPCHCPIAQALRRAFPGHNVRVGNAIQILINSDDKDYQWYRLSEDARLFIRTFDRGGIVYPFDMELVPCPDPEFPPAFEDD